MIANSDPSRRSSTSAPGPSGLPRRAMLQALAGAGVGGAAAVSLAVSTRAASLSVD